MVYEFENNRSTKENGVEIMALRVNFLPFKIKIVDFTTNTVTEESPSDEFINQIWEFFSKGNTKGYSEYIGKKYYELKGYEVEEKYKQKDYRYGFPDLFVSNGKEKFWVECKLYPDKISMDQIETLALDKGKILFVIQNEE